MIRSLIAPFSEFLREDLAVEKSTRKLSDVHMLEQREKFDANAAADSGATC